ncbi:MAG: DUF362 domain-containing protein, partial [Spirochaetota bacterium]
KKSAILGAGLFISPHLINGNINTATAQTLSPVSMVKGKDKKLMVEKAIELLGGISNFISKSDFVLVKPNIGWSKDEKYAANTSPDIVKKIVELCFDAGVAYVYVADRPCTSPELSYERSGIRTAAEEAGADVFIPRSGDMESTDLGGSLGRMDVMKVAFEVDKIINVPVAKHHNLATLTICMKNLMGLLGYQRSSIHRNIHRKLPELARYFKPALNVVDAYNIMVKNGPTGGNLDDLIEKNTVIASPDILTADAVTASLFTNVKDKNGETVKQFAGLDPNSVGYIKNGNNMGIGTSDFEKMDLKKTNV